MTPDAAVHSVLWSKRRVSYMYYRLREAQKISIYFKRFLEGIEWRFTYYKNRSTHVRIQNVFSGGGPKLRQHFLFYLLFFLALVFFIALYFIVALVIIF